MTLYQGKGNSAIAEKPYRSKTSLGTLTSSRNSEYSRLTNKVGEGYTQMFKHQDQRPIYFPETSISNLGYDPTKDSSQYTAMDTMMEIFKLYASMMGIMMKYMKSMSHSLPRTSYTKSMPGATNLSKNYKIAGASKNYTTSRSVGASRGKGKK